MAARKSKRRGLKKVSVRLFADNVEQLKERAAANYTDYQVLLRNLVDEALKAKQKVVML